MVFSSLSFLFIFLPLLLAVYFCPLCRSRRSRNGILLAFSLVFYGCGGWRALPLLAASVLINYIFGLLSAPGRPERFRSAACAVGTVCNLGLLFLFKYLGFVTENLARVLPAVHRQSLLLPVGISFFTFQGLSYLADIRRGTAEPERSLLNAALYLSFFPKLTMGPIVRFGDMAQELHRRRETADEAALGLQRFLFGLAKKVLLANQFSRIADAAFAQSPALLSTSMAWLGVIAYTLQIYFDFSGYSDMAIGLGRVFGFHFPENFNYPYIARSVTDFWRRWHISLSTWFRDYLYIPLGGSRVPLGRQILNLLIVWTLTGFWHGASWTFMLWGFYYALLLIGERYLWGGGLRRLPVWTQHLCAMAAVLFGWLIFRASGVPQILSFLKIMFGGAASGALGGQAVYELLEYRWELAAGILAALPVRDALRRRLERRRDSRLCAAILCWGPTALALALGGLAVLRLVESGFNSFIYFQF
ncbi:MAG: MBOAT family protein [Oscillibacter sp.]|jgi:alginate O-acetyltransferase complex protein AlgI|nr:MBOAT family protein [Oscillibacter sp.]